MMASVFKFKSEKSFKCRKVGHIASVCSATG